MPMFLLPLVRMLVGRGLPSWLANALAALLPIVLIVSVLGTAKCAYDRSIIRAKEAETDAANTRAAAAGTEKAAAARRVDDTRNRNQQQELENARRAETDTARRLARGCTILRQQARSQADIPERCRPDARARTEVPGRSARD